MSLASHQGDVASLEVAVTRTAQALTYCDVMSLNVQCLFEVMSTDEQFQQRVRDSRDGGDNETETLGGGRVKRVGGMRIGGGIGGKWRQKGLKLSQSTGNIPISDEALALPPTRNCPGATELVDHSEATGGARLLGVAAFLSASREAPSRPRNGESQKGEVSKGEGIGTRTATFSSARLESEGHDETAMDA